jgi:hypothetical protein
LFGLIIEPPLPLFGLIIEPPLPSKIRISSISNEMNDIYIMVRI